MSVKGRKVCAKCGAKTPDGIEHRCHHEDAAANDNWAQRKKGYHRDYMRERRVGEREHKARVRYYADRAEELIVRSQLMRPEAKAIIEGIAETYLRLVELEERT